MDTNNEEKKTETKKIWDALFEILYPKVEPDTRDENPTPVRLTDLLLVHAVDLVLNELRSKIFSVEEEYPEERGLSADSWILSKAEAMKNNSTLSETSSLAVDTSNAPDSDPGIELDRERCVTKNPECLKRKSDEHQSKEVQIKKLIICSVEETDNRSMTTSEYKVIDSDSETDFEEDNMPT